MRSKQERGPARERKSMCTLKESLVLNSSPLFSLLSFLPQPTPCWTNFAKFTEVKSCNSVSLCGFSPHSFCWSCQALCAHQVSGQDCAGFLGTYTKYIKRIPTIFQKKGMMLILGFYHLYILFLFLCTCISLWVCVPCVWVPEEPEEGVRFHGTRAADSWDLPGVGAGWSERVTSALNYWALSSPILFWAFIKQGFVLASQESPAGKTH